MVISYSHSEWFVPRLQDLTDPKRSSPRICVWHKSRRAPKKDGAHLVKCSSLIAEQDAKRADQLLKKIRNDMSSGHECLKILQEVCSLLLCKGTHRSSNADEIYKFLVAELESLEQSRKSANQGLSSPTQDPSSQPSTPSKVLQELGITASNKFKCHGQGKEGNGRANCTSQSSSRCIASIATGLTGEWHILPAVLELFGEQPDPRRCRPWHQDQAAVKPEDWTCAFNFDATMRTSLQFRQTPTFPYTSIRQSIKSSYETDDSSNIETSYTKSSPFWTPSRRPRSPESNATTPTSGSDGIQTTTTSPLADNLARHVSCKPGNLSLSTSTPRRTRSQAKNTTIGCSDPGLASPIEHSPAFAPLTTARSPLEAAKYLAEKIQQDISSSEFEPGFVYGFRRPDCDLIKIGFTTKTIAERMKSVESKCGFNVTVVFAIETNYAKKVEVLVHRHLYNQRRRERRCNGGKGCHPTQHYEWFEDVSDEYAESVVRAWVRWIDLKPYDGKGRLKEVWLEQIKLFNLHTSGDLWMQWTKIIQAKEVKEESEEEDAALQVEIKTERALCAVRGLSGPGRPLTSGFPCWKGVNKSLHGVRAPACIPRLQMVSA